MADFGQKFQQRIHDVTLMYSVAAAPWAVMYTFLVGYPYASSVVNDGLQYGLGNETTYQIPETVDEVVVKTIMAGVTETSWTLQITTILMTFGNFINLLTFLMTVLNFLLTIAPYIGATVFFIGTVCVNVVFFVGTGFANAFFCLHAVAQNMAGNDQAVPAVRVGARGASPAPVRAVRALAGRAVRRRA